MQWTGSGAGFALALRLSQLRSAIRVGLALAEKFPTEDSWEAAMASPEFQETASALAEVLQDVQGDLDVAPPDQVVETVLKHHERGLETLELFAEQLEVSADDILVVLSG
jgi:hypothetical protein